MTAHELESVVIKQESELDITHQIDYPVSIKKSDHQDLSVIEIKQEIEEIIPYEVDVVIKTEPQDQPNILVSEIDRINTNTKKEFKKKPKATLTHSKKSKKLQKIIKSEFQCKICSSVLLRKSTLSQHMRKFHQEPFEDDCKFCGLKFTNKYSFKQHTTNEHFYPKSGHFECDFCGKMVKAKALMNSHVQSHLPGVECPICNVKIKWKHIKAHLQNLHAVKNEFSCKICSKTFAQLSMLKRHEECHEKLWRCRCGKRFIDQILLVQHIQLDHENLGDFKCDVCHKKFTWIYDLKKHQKIHDKTRPKPYKCQKCDYETNMRQSYVRHEEVHLHQEQRLAAMLDPVICGLCLKFCRDKKALKNHERRVHPKVLLQCDLCGIYMKARCDIRRHINIHLRNKTGSFS